MTDVRNMRTIMEAVELSQPIDGYIDGEIHDLHLCMTELENIAELSRDDGGDATAGSVESAAGLIKQAISALERAKSEIGTSLDDESEYGDKYDNDPEYADMSDNMKQLARQGR